jgi:hypothetical protein
VFLAGKSGIVQCDRIHRVPIVNFAGLCLSNKFKVVSTAQSVVDNPDALIGIVTPLIGHLHCSGLESGCEGTIKDCSSGNRRLADIGVKDYSAAFNLAVPGSTRGLLLVGFNPAA